MERNSFLALLSLFVPYVIIALVSWLYLDTLGTRVMLAMFTWPMFLILLAIALFINVSYILYHFYRFVNYLSAIEQERKKDKQEAEKKHTSWCPKARDRQKYP